jgi:hypothetical protein
MRQSHYTKSQVNRATTASDFAATEGGTKTSEPGLTQ